MAGSEEGRGGEERGGWEQEWRRGKKGFGGWGRRGVARGEGPCVATERAARPVACRCVILGLCRGLSAVGYSQWPVGRPMAGAHCNCGLWSGHCGLRGAVGSS